MYCWNGSESSWTLLSKLTLYQQLYRTVRTNLNVTLNFSLTEQTNYLISTVGTCLNVAFLNLNLTEQSDKLILRITVNCWHGFECDLLELHLYWTNERGLPSWFVFVVSVSSISVSVPFSVSVTRPLSISIPGSLCIPVSSIWIPYQNENKITVQFLSELSVRIMQGKIRLQLLNTDTGTLYIINQLTSLFHSHTTACGLICIK